MAPDIRSFFGGKVPPPEPKENGTKKKDAAAPSKKRGRKVLDDSDEEEESVKSSPAKKASPKKATPKKRAPSPVEEATTTSDYFGKAKPKRSAPANTAPADKKKTVASTPKASPVKTTPNARSSGRAKKVVNYNEEKNSAEVLKLDHEKEGADDIFAEDYKNHRRGGKDDYEEETDEDEDVKPRAVRNGRAKQASVKKDEDDFEPDDVDMKEVDEDDFVVPDDDEEIVVDKPAKGKKAAATSARKRKSPALEPEDEDAEPTPKKKKPAAKPAKKKEDGPESKEMQEIFDSIPLVRPPTPPSSSGAKGKFIPGRNANAGPAPAAGSKDVPQGAENCLAGLSFVFTGLLESISRDEGQNLVKRYGGKVMTGPSSKTSYVVLGSDAGPKKLETIRKYGLKTINEDGLFELIRKLPANGGDSKAAEKFAEKKQEEERKVREMAQEAEREERRAGGAGGAGLANRKAGAAKPGEKGPDARLWTVKHAPTQMTQICGNKAQVEKLQRWLKNFPKNQKTGFKMAGADGSGVYRAVMIHGPPGIGKTTAAHLVAKMEGYDIVESNASDTRSKKLVETGLKGVLSTTSLMGYFAGDGKAADASKRKLVLIMDEVDGMSAGDRGGVGALAAVCKKTNVPMILICNDRRQPKMKPFDFVTYDLGFRRPTTDMIRSRIMTICFREGMKLPSNVLDALIEGTGGDIRQIVNMLSTVKLDQVDGANTMGYDESKKMSKAWEKHVVLKPWDILSKILGGGMFASSSKATLNEKSELYFNDHEFSYLMMQENYLGTAPTRAANYQGREKAMKTLELAEQAAASISEGDLVDRLIHGPEQHWSLMPTHAIFSFVRPASFVAGSMAGNRTAFTSWLGKNSSQGKFSRQIKEIQGHMRLRSSGDRHEIRQQYIPLLWDRLVKRLEVEGKEAVHDVIELMDSYFLTKEDWDSVLELGVGPMDMEKVKLESQTKAAFTRNYNQQSHPLPFMKASGVVAPKGRTAKEKPDLEEAIDESDEAEVIEDPAEQDEDEEVDLSKDKYVKQPKKKKAPAGKGKGKKAAEEAEDEVEAEKPKKAKGKGKAKK